jgi:hypothetical protein
VSHSEVTVQVESDTLLMQVFVHNSSGTQADTEFVKVGRDLAARVGSHKILARFPAMPVRCEETEGEDLSLWIYVFVVRYATDETRQIVERLATEIVDGGL